MLYFYVLKHSYRFGAEMFYLIRAKYTDIVNWERISITSIGCGPCTELFGTLHFWREINKPDVTFHFLGFDQQRLWHPFLSKVTSLFPQADIKLYNQNVFDYYQHSQEQMDIIVMNYMLSDMNKFNKVEFADFLYNFRQLVVDKRPQYIMINDIYLRDSIRASNALINTLLKCKDIRIRVGKRQLRPLDERIGQYGQIVPPKPFTMSDQRIVDQYDPFRETKSIQTIISVL